MRIVVVSLQSASVVDVLRARLPGYSPEAVASADDVPASLPADAVVLLDLEDGAAGLAAARELRTRGITSGIVVIGTAETEGLPAVIGVAPPIRVRQLADAVRRAWVEQRRALAEQGVSHEPGREAASDPGRPGRIGSAGTSGPPSPPVRRGRSEEEAERIQVGQRGSSRSGSEEPGETDWPDASDDEVADPLDSGLEERVTAILETTARIEEIAEILPAVTDVGALDSAIVATVVQSFDADAVGLWTHEAEGWTVTAHHGFSNRRARIVVSAEQPVMAELESTGGAVLLEPNESFRSMLVGLGAGSKRSFMAAAIAVGQYHLGILTVEREALLEDSDLDRLVALGREAAVGIGVARHIARMHVLADQGHAAHGGGGPPRPGRQAATAGGDEDFDTPGVIIQLPDHFRGRA